jgi:hypothetical protein
VKEGSLPFTALMENQPPDTGDTEEVMNIYHLPESSLSSLRNRGQLPASVNLCPNILHEDSLFLLTKMIIFETIEGCLLLVALTRSH